MNNVAASLADQLSSEFTQACAELAQARHRQRRKDTTAHRVAVTEWLTKIDVVLDLFLETAADRPQTAARNQQQILQWPALERSERRLSP
jgi:hypothetical protein